MATSFWPSFTLKIDICEKRYSSPQRVITISTSTRFPHLFHSPTLMKARLLTIARRASTNPTIHPPSNPPAMAPSPPLQLAILDDYQNAAAPLFAHLAPRLNSTSFPTTLDPSSPSHTTALIARLRPFALIAVMRERTPLPADVLGALPNLRLLITSGPQNAAIDLAACSRLGIVVAGSPPPPAAPTPSVSPRLTPSLASTKEHTWALILGLARNIARDDAVVRAGGWQTSYATGLAGKTLGVLGLGRLGAAVAHVGAVAFGMDVLAWSSSLSQAGADEKALAYGLPAGTFAVATSKEDLCRRADVLSMHYVLSDRSRGIIGAEELAVMKPTTLLVNTARGPLVDERSLLMCLERGGIAGVGLDVFEREPLGRESRWRTEGWGREGSGRVLLSPHTGYVEEGVMRGWYAEAVGHVERWLEGGEVVGRLN
ncbi:hypothetical protein MMC34_002771 [Xylographa carneopallida]|nr:hypothetical protein [Xylographa carneopallida]